jgi:DNA-binding NarL/FixJ family response regulator
MIKKRVNVSLTEEQWEIAVKMFERSNDLNKRFGFTEYSPSATNIIMNLIFSAISAERNKEEYSKPIENSKVHNARGAGRKRLDITFEQVKALRNSGLTTKQIADELKTSVSTVKRTLHPMLRFKKLKK